VLETEDHHDGKEGLNSWLTKTQRRVALAFNAGCLLRLLEALPPNAAVVG
jgi:hypothetical protein